MAKRGSVLVVSSSFPFGSGETFLISELNALANEGFRVIVVPLWPRGLRQDHPTLDPAIQVETLTRKYASLRPAVWDTLRRARSAHISNKSFGIRGIPRELISAALASALVHVAADLRADHLHAYWATGPSTACMHASRRLGIPWSFTAHSWDIPGNPLLAHKCDNVNGVRFISESGRARAALAGANVERAQVIHLGVDIPPRRILSRRSHSSIEIACPANLTLQKGHRYLLDAIRILKADGLTVRLSLFGEGHTRRDLEDQVAAFGLTEYVHFEGQIEHERLLATYKTGKFDVVVLPSIEMGSICEGVPVSLMEAMAHGVPVIGTRTGGVPELIPEGFGLLVPPADPESLASAISRLSKGSACYEAASAACFESVTLGFDSEVQGSQLASFIERCNE